MARPGNDRYLRRHRGSKKPRPAVLIVCEGESEEIYIRELIRTLRVTAQVHIPSNNVGSAPSSVLEFALEKIERDGPYDAVYCVFDRDNHESYQRTLSKISALASRSRKPISIRAIKSVPCFEVWVLLHFERTDAPFQDCAAVHARIRAHLPEYDKANVETARQLMPLLQNALGNAEWLAQRATTNESNPSTDLHTLVIILQALSSTNESTHD